MIFILENIIMEVLDWNINPSTVFELADDIFKYKFDDLASKYDKIQETFKDWVNYAIDGNYYI